MSGERIIQIQRWRFKIGSIPDLMWLVDRRTPIEVGAVIRAKPDAPNHRHLRWKEFLVREIHGETRLLKVDPA